MTAPPNDSALLSRIFTRIVAWRWIIVGVYAVLLPPTAYFATRVKQDNSIDRLIVATDPDYVATRAFAEVFGGGEFALILAEADDPFHPDVIKRVDEIERAVSELPGVVVNSALSVYRRAQAGFVPSPESAAAFRKFATDTDLFRHQGLVGDHYLAIGMVLTIEDTEHRGPLLAAIDRAIGRARGLGPLRGLYTLGQPYVNAYLDETQRSMWHYFVLFAVFVVVLTVGLYRSARTLSAVLITLAVCLAASMGFIGVTGGTLTIVSPMVPMTILVTAMANLVYIQSRFVQRPASRAVDAHQIFALGNKFIACTASVFATAVGFLALLVSNIRPIREMGVWVAAGLVLSWIIFLTLFPALQKILRTPTEMERPPAGDWIEGVATSLPAWSYRWRWPLVATAVLLSVLGGVALAGLPGVVAPMRVFTDPVEYMNHGSQLYRDIRRLEPLIPGLSVTNIWFKGDVGTMSEPEVLTGLHAFQQALERDPDVGAAVGPTTILRIIRYLSGSGDTWPTDPAELDQVASDLEGLVNAEPMLQRFVQAHTLSQAQVTLISRTAEYEGFVRLSGAIHDHWADIVARTPALEPIEIQIVGLNPLHAKMAQNLVPTVVESFLLTVVIIFAAFLVIFRSGAARLMAMIPSIFAILVMFLIMRLLGMQLNIATILIASTVLGTSENDQIHFFYHFLEGRRDGSVEHALRHTLLIAGRAIFFATLINAGGFVAFVLAELPPVREFGFLASLAFVLSMIADFTALPAALWILFRERPDARALGE